MEGRKEWKEMMEGNNGRKEWKEGMEERNGERKESRKREIKDFFNRSFY